MQIKVFNKNFTKEPDAIHTIIAATKTGNIPFISTYTTIYKTTKTPYFILIPTPFLHLHCLVQQPFDTILKPFHYPLQLLLPNNNNCPN